ncbi:heme-binding protein [Mycobacterium deserti]|uniref:Heme-binding protein n=1 Tax=Mycobacterium deserti TaxID=2978347 RepID=A0ABT2M9Y2_9MYCO|nr:heme-binding protein [Mycobacterium deserti]MCT7657811.1 heme-binding protein [Mycobacterium deserti]
MKMSATTVRRGLYGMFAGGLLALGSAAMVAPAANAQPGPGAESDCSLSAIASTSSTVSASTSTYLASNPVANEALTEIATQPQEQATEAFRTYFAENPQVESELTAINQPAADLSSQCGIDVTPTPISTALIDV